MEPFFPPFTRDLGSFSKDNKTFLISPGDKVYIPGYRISPPAPREDLFTQNKRYALSLNSRGEEEICQNLQKF